MIEIDLEEGAIKYLQDYAQGEHIGLLASNTRSNHKNHRYHTDILGTHYHKTYFVDNFSTWKEAFLALQEEVDLIIMPEYASMADWNQQQAEAFVLQHTQIPSAAMQKSIADLALIGITKFPDEQGIWAARAAIKILLGASPSSIPISRNRITHLHPNQKLAKRLGLKLSLN